MHRGMTSAPLTRIDNIAERTEAGNNVSPPPFAQGHVTRRQRTARAAAKARVPLAGAKPGILRGPEDERPAHAKRQRHVSILEHQTMHSIVYRPPTELAANPPLASPEGKPSPPQAPGMGGCSLTRGHPCRWTLQQSPT